MRTRLLAAFLTAIGLLFFCAVPAEAAGGQRAVTLPPGGPYRLGALLERTLGPFEAMAVTLPPEEGRAAIFLNRRPLAAYRMVGKEDLAAVSVFVRAGPPVTIGVTTFSKNTPEQADTPRIRCINPDFSGKPNVTEFPIFKEAVIID